MDVTDSPGIPESTKRTSKKGRKRGASPLQKYRGRLRTYETFLEKAEVGYKQITPGIIDTAMLVVAADRTRARVAGDEDERDCRRLRDLAVPGEIYEMLVLSANHWSCNRRKIYVADVIRCALVLFAKYGVPGVIQKREFDAQQAANKLLELRDYLTEETIRDLRLKLYDAKR